jgi:hypothetical protein
MLEDWPLDWVSKIVEDFPKTSRETRIFLAKALRLISVHLARQHTDGTT